jgi:hypothetical protein
LFEGTMQTGLSDPCDRTSANSALTATPATARRDRVERQFVDKVRAMAGLHLTAADGVERAAYELVDVLREEGLHCEHALLALKALVRRSAAEPPMLISEIVPRCITYYYKTSSQDR